MFNFSCQIFVLLFVSVRAFSPLTLTSPPKTLYISGSSVWKIAAPSRVSLAASTQTLLIPEVLDAIDQLFPPNGLDQRIALSRKDGYWPYISSGDEPPQEFVYGEFDTKFFARILHRTGEILAGGNDPSFQDWVFCDLGSGTGRLVLSAAGLFPWKLCRGVELLEGIHAQAIEKLEACQQCSTNVQSFDTKEDNTSFSESAYWKQYKQFSSTTNEDWLNELSSTLDDKNGGSTTSSDSQNSNIEYNHEASEEQSSNQYCLTYDGAFLPLSPIQLRCGSFTDPYEFFGDSNVVFVYSSAMPYHILIDLAHAIGRQCQPGTLVITTEYQLPTGGHIPPCEDDVSLPHGDYELELLETLTGENDSTGGLSTVYIQRLTKSVGDGIPRSPPELPVSEIAYRVIKQLERGELNNPKLFLRNVSNQMAFLGLPESWRPKLIDD